MVAALTLSSEPAQAERWVKAGATSLVGDDFAFCVDMDSVKTGADGWTSYAARMCSEPREVFERAVNCAQDFSVDQVPLRTRTLIANGVAKPAMPRQGPILCRFLYRGSFRPIVSSSIDRLSVELCTLDRQRYQSTVSRRW